MMGTPMGFFRITLANGKIYNFTAREDGAFEFLKQKLNK